MPLCRKLVALVLGSSLLTSCAWAPAVDPARTQDAASTALKWFTEWYGAPAPEYDISTGPRLQRFTPGSSRQYERDVARHIASRYWSPPLGPALDDEFERGLILFSVERLMREAYSGDGYVETRYFWGAAPWVTRGLPPGLAGSGRSFRALLTLERYLGWPLLQQALLAFRERYASEPATPAQLVAFAEEFSLRDLSWLLPIFDPAVTFDYGIDRVASRPVDGGHRVEVVARRFGDGQFTGTSASRVGPYEAGRGLRIVVTFADGQQVVDRWDGRDQQRRLVYDSPTPPVSAAIDPDEVLAVDTATANNWLRVSRGNAHTSVAWAARWATWLQDRLLLWSALI
jgi:hypothetical protein